MGKRVYNFIFPRLSLRMLYFDIYWWVFFYNLYFYLYYLCTIFIAMPWDASFGNTTSTPTYIPPSAAIVSIIAVLLGLGDSGFNTQIMGILGNLYKVIVYHRHLINFILGRLSASFRVVQVCSEFYRRRWIFLFLRKWSNKSYSPKKD